MSIIDPNDLSGHAKTVAAGDEQLVKDGFGRLELAFARLANADGVDERKRAAALEKLAEQASQLEAQLRTGATAEEALKAIFGGDSTESSGSLNAPNADRATEVAHIARQKLGGVAATEAARRAEAAKRILDGSTELHPSGELQLVVEARDLHTTATNAVQQAEAQRDAAKQERDAAEAVVADAKDHSHRAAVGRGLVIELDNIQPATKTAFGV